MENDTQKIEPNKPWLNGVLRAVPYISELNLITPGGSPCPIFAELEYQFGKHPDGFFMHYEPKPENPTYKKYGSWKEKLYEPVAKIKMDFVHIGIRYDSLKEFEAAGDDKFKDKFYCSIYEAKGQRAFYLRNNTVVDEAIRSVLGDVTVPELYDRIEKQEEILWQQKQAMKDKGETNFPNTFFGYDVIHNPPASIVESQEEMI